MLLLAAPTTADDTEYDSTSSAPFEHRHAAPGGTGEKAPERPRQAGCDAGDPRTQRSDRGRCVSAAMPASDAAGGTPSPAALGGGPMQVGLMGAGEVKGQPRVHAATVRRAPARRRRRHDPT